MSIPIRISEATVGDAESIRDLAVRIWNACYPGIISQAQIDYMLEWMYRPKQIRREIRDEGIVYLRIDGPESLIGFAAFGPGESEADVFVHKLYLDPAVQRRGIGTAIIREIERRARALGAERISMRVNRNNHAAIKAYESCGYRRSRTVCSDIGEGFAMDDFVMLKKLTGEA